MFTKFKKFLNILSAIFLYSLLTLMIIIFIVIGVYFIDQSITKKNGVTRAPLFGAYVIVSGSMEPNVKVYDAVFTIRKNQEQIKVNDIITFVSQNPQHNSATVTHRVIGVVKLDDGRISYRTKGDNNNVADSYLVNYNNVIGKVLFKIPKIGYLQLLINNHKLLFLLFIPSFIIIFSDIINIFVKNNKVSVTKNLTENNEEGEII